MNKKNFIKILQNPENLTAEELSFLDEINLEFPYFQISKAIYLKTLKENDDIKLKNFSDLQQLIPEIEKFFLILLIKVKIKMKKFTLIKMKSQLYKVNIKLLKKRLLRKIVLSSG